MSQRTAITVAYGDGIGPEIMEASLHIIQSAGGASLEIEKIQEQILGLIHKVAATGYDIVKTETLPNFDGQRGYTLAQGR